MKGFVFFLLIVLVSSPAFATLRDDVDMLNEEKKKIRVVYDEFYKKYSDKYKMAIRDSSDCQFVEAYINVCEVQQLWYEGWTVFVCGAMALFEGETKFTVIPGAIEKIDSIEKKLEEKYFQMRLFVDNIHDEKLKQIFSKFVNDSRKEFKMIYRYNVILTSY